MFRVSFVFLALASALVLNGCTQCNKSSEQPPAAPAESAPAAPTEEAAPAAPAEGTAPADAAATPAAQ